MFNPQRKSKIADIFMQEKSFQKHLEKVRSIKQSKQLKSARYSEEQRQKRYLKRLAMSKNEVKSRLSNDIYHQNHRVFLKLINTDKRSEEYPEVNLQRKYFNSHVNNKKQAQRIKNDNLQLINKLINEKSVIAPLKDMKRQYKQSRRYSKMVQKLPSILKHQEQYKRDLSMKRLNQSKSSNNSYSSRKHLNHLRSTTQMQQINKIQKTLIEKQNQEK